MSRDTLLPHGEALRRAIRWLSDERRHDAQAIDEAARRFDLTPVEEEFLLDWARDEVRRAAPPRKPGG